jgi:hypothetical protein
MPVIRFTGTVLPKAARLTNIRGHQIRWNIDETTEVTFDIRVIDGLLTVECNCPRDIDNDVLVAIYIRALDLSKASVDMASFAMGKGFIVTLDRYISPRGTFSGMMPEDSSLVPLCTSYGLSPDRDTDFSKVFEIVVSQPAIFMALNDLVTAITIPHSGPVSCYRAIEGIRHLIAPGLKPIKQWPLMNDALRLEQTYIAVIRENATQQRHGNRVHVPGTVLAEMVRRSWIIMDRFLEYKKRGSIPLPQPEFPTLK